MSVATTVKFPVWPHIAADEIASVTEVLQSGKINYWTGSYGKQFETEFAKYIGCKYAVAVSNGTVGLELALLAIGIKPGDEVIVPSKTFIATASCVVACDAIPVVADVDLFSQNISAETIAPLISKKTKAIIVVHLGGLACNMDPILAIAKQHNLKIIEDCAQAHGARYKNKLVGSIGDVSVFSYCQDKIMTTGGEGGMLLSNDAELWQRAWEYKDHGKDYFAVYDSSIDPKSKSFRWLHNSFGSNYRMTEMQAAIGLLQLQKLPVWVQIRRRNAEFLLQGMKDISGVKVFMPASSYWHSYYKFYFHIDTEVLIKDWNKTKIQAAINQLGIPCFEGSCSEIYREQAFVARGFGPATRLPNAQKLTDSSLLLEVHPRLELEHMQIMLDGVKQVISTAVA